MIHYIFQNKNNLIKNLIFHISNYSIFLLLQKIFVREKDREDGYYEGDSNIYLVLFFKNLNETI